VKQCLANDIDTRSLIRRRGSRKRAEDAETALHKERAEHETTKIQLKSTTSELVSTKSQLAIVKSEHEVTKVELTNTKTQLADKDTALENANKVIESFENQAYMTTPANPLQQENNELSKANDASAGTMAQLEQEARKAEQRVAELEEGKAQSSHSANAKTGKVEETEERSDAAFKQGSPETGSTNDHLDTLRPAGEKNSIASEIPEISSGSKVSVATTNPPSATNIERSPRRAPSAVSSRGSSTAAMLSKSPGSRPVPGSPLLERSTSVAPLTATPGEEGASPEMTECRFCQAVMPKKQFSEVHFKQCKRPCEKCGTLVPLAFWKEHQKAYTQCEYCNQYSCDWKVHTSLREDAGFLRVRQEKYSSGGTGSTQANLQGRAAPSSLRSL